MNSKFFSILPSWCCLHIFAALKDRHLIQEDQRALHCKAPKMKLSQKTQHLTAKLNKSDKIDELLREISPQ